MTADAKSPPDDQCPSSPGVIAPLWILGLVTFSGTLGLHIFVPALPFAATDLRASIAEMQQTVSLYIIGLALGQLFYGPLSDRFGRRPVLMFGLGLYTVAGLTAALATHPHLLIVARLLQALGGCAGLVLGRAIIRDASSIKESTRRLALMATVTTLGPGIAPLIGAALASTAGWRAIFFFLSAMGFASLLCTWRLLPETATTSSAPGSTALVARNYRKLLMSPTFLAYALAGGCATTSLYAFVASAPFVFVNQLQVPAHELGVYMAIPVFGVAIGSAIATRLIGRMHIQTLTTAANAISMIAAITLLGAVVANQLSVTFIISAMFVFTVGVGAAGPGSSTLAISVDRHAIGSASGLYGFIQMSVGAVCTALVGLGHDPALAAAVVLAMAGVIAQVCYRFANRRQRLGKA